MPVTHWVLGVILGSVAGASILTFGTLGLMVVVPVLIWAAAERRRPIGLAGSLVGAGIGIGGLLSLAAVRCAATDMSVDGVSESCTAPDVTGLIAAALVLVVAGAILTIVGVRGASPKPGT